jgi:GTP-binding protein HflX
VEREPCDDVAEAARLQLEVGGLEDDRKCRIVDHGGPGEERRQRIVLGGQLFPAEEEKREIARRRLQVDAARQLERDGEPTFHVAGAESMHLAVAHSSWEVALCRNRVVVGGKDDQWEPVPSRRDVEERLVARVLLCPAGRHEVEYVLADRSLVAALRRNVDQLERPRGKAVGERGHRGSVPRHNLAVTARQPDPAPGAEPERGFLVGVFPKGTDAADELMELGELARTAGVLPVGELVQNRVHPDPRSFVGKGKLAELKQTFGDADAEALLVDDELSPTQQRTLEDALKTRVVDRTQLILDIFAQHARSAEGKLQVELAQLEYNLPRMRGMWQHLERLGGGVGTRGPGESQLETDRRLARTRVSLLKKRLRTLGNQRSTRRKERIRTSAPTIALAGYTNVGKSTLLNALTGAEVSVDDRLFETLDPTTRGFEHDGKRYLVTDTVGFIRRLPTQLVEGFAATLEETLVADLVLHIADASLPEERLAETIAAVSGVLAEIGADDIPVELVLNKVDALDPLGRRRIEHAYPRALLISAQTGEGLGALKERIAELFSDRFEDVRLLVPYSDGRTLAALYDLGAPIAERRDTPEGVRVRARLPRAEAARFARYLVAEEHELEKASAR